MNSDTTSQTHQTILQLVRLLLNDYRAKNNLALYPEEPYISFAERAMVLGKVGGDSDVKMYIAGCFEELSHFS